MATALRTGFDAGRRVTTNGHRPQRTPLLLVVGRFAGQHLPRWAALRTAVLQIMAVVVLVAGAFTLWGLGVALLVACPALLVLELVSGETPRQ